MGRLSLGRSLWSAAATYDGQNVPGSGMPGVSEQLTCPGPRDPLLGLESVVASVVADGGKVEPG